MSKISLIIKREYTTRVMKPSFIILTFLTPVLIAGMIMIPLFLSQIKDDAVKKILVIDQTNLYVPILVDNENYDFEQVQQSLDEFKNDEEKKEYAALLYISED